jgi:alpha-galactosidase
VQARKIGVNLVVLDDGWFSTRNECGSEWLADSQKFPLGLSVLAQEINKQGCKFGVWVAPELVSRNSVGSINCFVAHF